jgi:hypothetical protein
MQSRTLGADGLKVSAIGLGCMGLGAALRPGGAAREPRVRRAPRANRGAEEHRRRRRRAHAGDLREIEDAQIEAQGARYAEANERMIDR